MIESFPSQPTNQACVRDRALGTSMTCLDTRTSARSSGGVARTTEPTARTAHATSHIARSRRQTCSVANIALCCALFEILFMDTIHEHYSWIWVVTTLLIKIYSIQCKDKKTYCANLYLKSSTSFFFFVKNKISPNNEILYKIKINNLKVINFLKILFVNPIYNKLI